MKVLNISLDRKILNKNSAAAKRVVEYEKLVDKYTVIALDNKKGKLSNFFKIFSEAKRILKNEKYNVITVQDVYFAGWLALKLAKKFNLGLEVQIHGFEKLVGIRKILAKKVLKNADAIRVVSQRLRKKLVDEFKVNANKITVASIHTDIRKTAGLFRSARNDNKFIFLTVGRLVSVKNIEMQIRALNNILKQHKNIELWIVGDGSEYKKLKNLINALRVTRYAKLYGWQNNLEKYYSQADAFLLTSNFEGWGMVVVEAAQFNLPIIMTDVGLAGEVIEDNESGIVIPVGDQEKLEQAMIKLIEDENLRQKLGDGAREAIKKLPTKEETLALMKKSWEKARKK